MNSKVVITGGNSLVGQALIPALKQKGYFVTTLTRKSFSSKADENITDWMNSNKAKEAIKSADFVVHLTGEIFARTWDEFYQPNVKPTEVIAEQIKIGNVKKVVFLSYPGANPNSDNLFLKSKGQAEKILTDTSKDVVIFRVQAIMHNPNEKGPFEDYLTYKGTEPVRVIGNGKTPIHTIYQDDVITAILKSLEANNEGVYDLFNEVIELNDLVKLINKGQAIKQANTPIFVARLFSMFSKNLSPTTVNLYSRKQVLMDNTKTVKDFGLTFVSVKKLWQ